jgi:GxxExxY protein
LSVEHLPGRREDGKKTIRIVENTREIFEITHILHEGFKICKMYNPTQKEELLCEEIVDCIYRVHKELGPGLLEKIYEICLCHELNKKGINFKRQVNLPIFYDGLLFAEGLRLDVLIEETIICELKAVDIVNPVWQAQILSHLKMTKKNIGFLINFNVALIKNGIRRYCVE